MRSSQRTTSQRMKPRAISVWIVAAASIAVRPRRSVHARVSFSPAVKNVIRSRVSARRRTIDARADSPPARNSAASSSVISASSASSCRSIPAGPFTIDRSGFLVSGSSSGGSSSPQSASVFPESRCASSRSSSSASCFSFASPDFACLATRSRRRSTWSRSATSSSSFSVSRSSSGTRVPEKPSRTTRSASTWRSFPSSSGPVPRTSTTLIAAGVTLRACTTSASCRSRVSGIAAIPTSPCARAPVSAANSIDLPELCSPTIPTSSDTAKPYLRLLGDLLLERGEGAVLQRLDRALRLPEDRGHVGIGEAEDELEREDLLLLGRQRLDHLQHRLAPDRVHGEHLRGRLFRARRLGHFLLRLPAPPRAEVIHREVVRDPEEPRRERRRPPAEPPDRLEHLQERLRRQVLGVVPVADAHVEVAVDPVEVDEVQLLERVPVALLGAVDERADVLIPGTAHPFVLPRATDRTNPGGSRGGEADAGRTVEPSEVGDLGDDHVVRAFVGVENDDAGAVLVQRPFELVGAVLRGERPDHLAASEPDLEPNPLTACHSTPPP